MKIRRALRGAVSALLLLVGLSQPWLAGAQSVAAVQLRERFAALRAQGAGNPFPLPVFLASSETGERLQGEVHALVAAPFAQVRPLLAGGAARWCEILMLHLNVKACRADGDWLQLGVGRKFDQPLDKVSWVQFRHRVLRSELDHASVELQAAEGPMGTRDYRIAVEIAPAADAGTILHLSYAYAYGSAARWAMQAYLATLARDKRGFSVVGRAADGSPLGVGGLRGVIERNTMRYHLAIEATIEAQALPADQRQARALELWFDATERHALQLHELERAEYLAMKRRELARPVALLPR